MNKLTVMTTLFGLSVLSAASAFAQHPGVDEVKGMVGKGWTGTIQQVNDHEDEKWHKGCGRCQITITSPTTVLIYTHGWRMHRKAVLTGGFGHGGGDAAKPVAIGGKKWSPNDANPNEDKDDVSDNGVVRLQWNSANEVEFQWWPSEKAQAGRRSHQPPHVSGKLKR